MKRIAVFAFACLLTSTVYAQLGMKDPLWSDSWSPSASHHDSVVKIICNEGQSVFWSGTGVYVEGERFLTATHVIEGSGKIKAIFQDGTSVELRILECNSRSDLSVLVPVGKMPEGKTPVKVCSEVPLIGARLEVCGFAGDEGLRHFFATVKGTDRSRVVLDGYAIQGDSGGPVFNASGEVVLIISGGVLWHEKGIMSGGVSRQVTTPIIGPLAKQRSAMK